MLRNWQSSFQWSSASNGWETSRRDVRVLLQKLSSAICTWCEVKKRNEWGAGVSMVLEMGLLSGSEQGRWWQFRELGEGGGGEKRSV